MFDENAKGIAFCQTDGIYMESVLVVVDACALDVAFRGIAAGEKGVEQGAHRLRAVACEY